MIKLLANPYALLAAGALFLLAVGGAYWRGQSDGRNAVHAQMLRAMKKATDELNRRRAVIDRINGQLAIAQTAQSTEVREIFHESVRIVEKPIYRTLCGDASGSGLFDRARANANRAAGEPSFTPARTASDAP